MAGCTRQRRRDGPRGPRCDCATVDPRARRAGEGGRPRGRGRGHSPGQPTIPPTVPPSGRVDCGSWSSTRAAVGRRRQRFLTSRGARPELAPGTIVREVTLHVAVDVGTGRVDVYRDLAAHPGHPRWIGHVLSPDQPADPEAVVGLDLPADDGPGSRVLAHAGAHGCGPVRGGHDGERAGPDEYARALAALGRDRGDRGRRPAGRQRPPRPVDRSRVGAGADRARRDATAIAWPWSIRPSTSRSPRCGPSATGSTAVGPRSITRGSRSRPDGRPTRGPPARLLLPPSGFVAGHLRPHRHRARRLKAPANEVVRGLTGSSMQHQRPPPGRAEPRGHQRAARLLRPRQPGVGRAHDDARTRSGSTSTSGACFIFLEHSIDKATQWAVFEPNDERAVGDRSARRSRTSCCGPVADRGVARHEAGGGVLRAVRPHDDDAERPRQRAADLPHRRRPGRAGRVRDLPHRSVDRRRPGLNRGRGPGGQGCCSRLIRLLVSQRHRPGPRPGRRTGRPAP